MDGCMRFLYGRLLPIPWRADVYEDTRPLRIAYYDFDGYIEASPACRRAVHEAAAVLEAAGHKLVRFSPPDVSEAMEIFFALLSCGADHIADELQGETVADALTKLMLQVRACALLPVRLLAHTVFARTVARSCQSRERERERSE